MTFPSPPWALRGQMWLSLFSVRPGSLERPPGLYGVAFVDYQPGSVLTYRELVVARLIRAGVSAHRVRITDIWVDAPASRAGGRSLWAIPKELADLHLDEGGLPGVARTTAAASLAGAPVAAARFVDVRPPVSPRLPMRLLVDQERDGFPAVAKVTGNACPLPCLGTWDFAAQGPLAWLQDQRPMGSFALHDFRLDFGT